MLAKPETETQPTLDAATCKEIIAKAIPAPIRAAEARISKLRHEREKLAENRREAYNKLHRHNTYTNEPEFKLSGPEYRELEQAIPELEEKIEAVNEKISKARRGVESERARYADTINKTILKELEKALGGVGQIETALETMERLHVGFKAAEDAYRGQGMRAPWARDVIPHIGRAKVLTILRDQIEAFKTGTRFRNGAGNG